MTDGVGITEAFGAITAYALTTGITPGPNNIYLLSIGVQRGIRAGLPYLSGVMLGYLVMITVLTFGLAVTFTHYPIVEQILISISLCFLLYMAWNIARSDTLPLRKNNDNDVPDNSDKKDNPQHKGKYKYIGLWGAAIFQFANPKAWVIATSAVSVHLREATVDIVLTTVKILVLVGITVLCSAAWLCFGTQLRNFLTTPTTLKRFNITMAVLLVCSVVLVIA